MNSAYRYILALSLVLVPVAMASDYDIGGSIGIYIKVTNNTDEVTGNDNNDAILPDNYGTSSEDHNSRSRDTSNDESDDGSGSDNEAYYDGSPERSYDLSLYHHSFVTVAGDMEREEKFAYVGEQIQYGIYAKGDTISSMEISAGNQIVPCQEEVSALAEGESLPETFAEGIAYETSMQYFVCELTVGEDVAGAVDILVSALDSDGNLMKESREEYILNMPLTMDVLKGDNKLFVQNSQAVPMTIRQSCNSKFMTVHPNNYRNVRLDECKGNYLVGSVE